MTSPLRYPPPAEPPPSQWELTAPPEDYPDELVGAGADLEPGTLLQAYRKGLFPMPLPEQLRDQVPGQAAVGWWSPNPRGVLPLDGLVVSKSLRRSCQNFEIRVDTAFDEVVARCADPSRPHGWIDDEIKRAYRRLFELGWVHSIEAWSKDDNTLAGGLYGVATNGLFAGESMFHTRRDASKVALVGLVNLLQEKGFALLDVQWKTDHLASLGVVDIPRSQYFERLARALAVSPDLLGPLP